MSALTSHQESWLGIPQPVPRCADCCAPPTLLINAVVEAAVVSLAAAYINPDDERTYLRKITRTPSGTTTLEVDPTLPGLVDSDFDAGDTGPDEVIYEEEVTYADLVGLVRTLHGAAGFPGIDLPDKIIPQITGEGIEDGLSTSVRVTAGYLIYDQIGTNATGAHGYSGTVAADAARDESDDLQDLADDIDLDELAEDVATARTAYQAKIGAVRIAELAVYHAQQARSAAQVTIDTWTRRGDAGQVVTATALYLIKAATVTAKEALLTTAYAELVTAESGVRATLSDLVSFAQFKRALQWRSDWKSDVADLYDANQALVDALTFPIPIDDVEPVIVFEATPSAMISALGSSGDPEDTDQEEAPTEMAVYNSRWKAGVAIETFRLEEPDELLLDPDIPIVSREIDVTTSADIAGATEDIDPPLLTLANGEWTGTTVEQETDLPDDTGLTVLAGPLVDPIVTVVDWKARAAEKRRYGWSPFDGSLPGTLYSRYDFQTTSAEGLVTEGDAAVNAFGVVAGNDLDLPFVGQIFPSLDTGAPLFPWFSRFSMKDEVSATTLRGKAGIYSSIRIDLSEPATADEARAAVATIVNGDITVNSGSLLGFHPPPEVCVLWRETGEAMYQARRRLRIQLKVELRGWNRNRSSRTITVNLRGTSRGMEPGGESEDVSETTTVEVGEFGADGFLGDTTTFAGGHGAPGTAWFNIPDPELNEMVLYSEIEAEADALELCWGPPVWQYK